MDLLRLHFLPKFFFGFLEKGNFGGKKIYFAKKVDSLINISRESSKSLTMLLLTLLILQYNLRAILPPPRYNRLWITASPAYNEDIQFNN
jgi:hypothetical protein